MIIKDNIFFNRRI